MNIVIPMGGQGERFKQAGYGVYKPFLPLQDGRAMIEHVLECYPPAAHFILVVRKEHMEELAEAIPEFKARIFLCEERTPGPLQTLLWTKGVKEVVGTEDPLLIADCDSLISPRELVSALDTFSLTEADGGVTVRHCLDEGCSYAKVDAYGWVKETREKDPFTSTSTTGPYWFRRGMDLVRYGSKAMGDGVRSISPVYNYFLEDGKRVKAIAVNSFRHLGTPEAYETAINNTLSAK